MLLRSHGRKKSRKKVLYFLDYEILIVNGSRLHEVVVGDDDPFRDLALKRTAEKEKNDLQDEVSSVRSVVED